MRHAIIGLLLCGLMLPVFGAIQGTIGNDGSIALVRNGQRIGRIFGKYYLPNWTARHFPPKFGAAMTGHALVTYGGMKEDQARVKLTLTWQVEGARSLRFKYTFTPEADLEANGIFVDLTLPFSEFMNRPFAVDGRTVGNVPSVLGKEIHLFHGQMKTFTLDSTFGTLTLSSPVKQELLVQDNRKWSNNLSVRICATKEQGGCWRKGVNYPVEFVLTFPEDLELSLNQPYMAQADDEWIPLTQHSLDIQAGSALDFTSVVKLDPPAGRHGYVKAVGPHFEFEGKPGVSQRFYGVNFCFGTHNLSCQESETLATRLARLGYNAVRYHHHESAICQLHIPGDSTQLDPQRMAQFDGLFAAMKAKGLYATTDMYVSRRVYDSEAYVGGNPRKKVNRQAYKMLCAFSPHARQNWKKFSRNFLLHVNPHTGLSYAQDPALMLISLVNEGTLSVYGVKEQCADPRFKTVVLKAWRSWLDRKYGNAKARNQAWKTNLETIEQVTPPADSERAARDFESFLADAEIDLLRDLGGFLKKELKCRALVTNMNYQGRKLCSVFPRAEMDCVDEHFYVDHPRFVKRSWGLPSHCAHTNVISRNARAGGIASQCKRLMDKPFTLTEWNYSAPGRYRGLGGIMTGSLASLQDWSGLWCFEYSHDAKILENHPIAFFDLMYDPLNQAANRAGILLYLRRDMPAARHAIVTGIDRQHQEDSRNLAERTMFSEWYKLGFLARISSYVGKAGSNIPACDLSVSYSVNAPKGAYDIPFYQEAQGVGLDQRLLDRMRDNGWIPADNETDLKKGIIQTADGSLTLDSETGTMKLDTPRTAGCFAPAGQTVKTSSLTVRILEAEATVWISSLSEQPIPQAKRLLLTHLTDLQNTGQTFNEKERRTLLAWGHLPHLVRNGRADVVVRLEKPAKATVWAIDTAGRRLHKVPGQVTPEGLKITLSVAGSRGAQMMYEIVVE